jgi:hypothetical protein
MGGQAIKDALASGQSYGADEKPSEASTEIPLEGMTSYERSDLGLLAEAIDKNDSLSHFWATRRRQWAKRVLALFQQRDTNLEKMIASKGMSADAIKSLKTQLKNLGRQGAAAASTDQDGAEEDQI